MQITQSAVTQIDWLTAIRRGLAFVGGQGITGAAGQQAHVQLLNPAGSGITVVMHKCKATRDTAGSLLFHRHDTALTTLETTQVNLLIGGTAPVGQIRTVSNAGNLGTLIFPLATPSDQTLVLFEEWGPELGPGEGVVVINPSAAGTLRAVFEWIELTN